MTPAHRSRQRDGIRRRLGDMDSQIHAIESMAANMDHDFRSARTVRRSFTSQNKWLNFLCFKMKHLLQILNTVEQMSEAILPSNERFPPSQLLQPRSLETDTLERTVRIQPIGFISPRIVQDDEFVDVVFRTSVTTQLRPSQKN